jgi:hypothetical protein
MDSDSVQSQLVFFSKRFENKKKIRLNVFFLVHIFEPGILGIIFTKNLAKILANSTPNSSISTKTNILTFELEKITLHN